MDHDPDFGELLITHMERHGLSIGELARLVGVADSTVLRWREGSNRPNSLQRVSKVAAALQIRDPKAWGQFVEKAGYMAEFPTPLSNPPEPEIPAQQSPPPTGTLWPPGLPSGEPYYLLPQRDEALRQVVAVLRRPDERRIVAIDGLGGLGKTALAIEIGRRCLQAGQFRRVLGESAKQKLMVGEVLLPTGEARLSRERLLDGIARQLGRWDIPPMAIDEKRLTIQQLLRRAPYLLIVDNLESSENTQEIALELQHLVRDSCAIITSRLRLGLDFVYGLSLEGLGQVDSRIFLQAEAHSRNRHEILGATDEALTDIWQATGGAPLAMKLVVGQASTLPLEIVVANLRRTSTAALYRFIYLESWQLLSVAAQRLLVYMGTVPTTCAYQELASVEIAEDEATLQAAIQEATRLSLLNPASASGQLRYGIHPLTRHFVNGELRTLWKEQGLL